MEQGLQWPVCEGKDLVALGLAPPQLHHLGHPFGLLGGQVLGLGEVLGHVVELPDVLVKGGVGVEAVGVDGPHRVEGDRLPTPVVDGPRPQHLEVLGLVALGGIGPVGSQQVGEAHAIEVGLRHVVDDLRRLDADQFQHGGHDVDGVGELVPHAAGGSLRRRGHWTMHGSATPPGAPLASTA